MYDELTPVDIQKMKEEIEYRVTVLRPKLIEDVKTAREWGDLSENFEYKAAKREKNRNDSRVRYLERMIRTAKVVEFQQTEGIGLFDEVEIYLENLKKTQTVRIATALRQDAMHGIISKDSPVGKALLGRRQGDRVEVVVSDAMSYFVEIRKVTKAKEDDASLAIRGYSKIQLPRGDKGPRGKRGPFWQCLAKIKKVLTNGAGFGILIRHSRERAEKAA